MNQERAPISRDPSPLKAGASPTRLPVYSPPQPGIHGPAPHTAGTGPVGSVAPLESRFSLTERTWRQFRQERLCGHPLRVGSHFEQEEEVSGGGAAQEPHPRCISGWLRIRIAGYRVINSVDHRTLMILMLRDSARADIHRTGSPRCYADSCLNSGAARSQRARGADDLPSCASCRNQCAVDITERARKVIAHDQRPPETPPEAVALQAPWQQKLHTNRRDDLGGSSRRRRARMGGTVCLAGEPSVAEGAGAGASVVTVR